MVGKSDPKKTTGSGEVARQTHPTAHKQLIREEPLARETITPRGFRMTIGIVKRGEFTGSFRPKIEWTVVHSLSILSFHHDPADFIAKSPFHWTSDVLCPGGSTRYQRRF